MNGMCCLGDSDNPSIRICIGEEGGMNDSGSWSETSDDKGRPHRCSCFANTDFFFCVVVLKQAKCTRSTGLVGTRALNKHHGEQIHSPSLQRDIPHMTPV